MTSQMVAAAVMLLIGGSCAVWFAYVLGRHHGRMEAYQRVGRALRGEV